MGLTTALNTSLNGLTLNETAIEVLGNNIANAGTNGYKSSAVQFTTQLARTLSVGSSPQGTNGGTNPLQVGLGASTATVFRDFSQGAITSSTSPSDLAIEGAGFFVLKGSAEGQAYSRNGNFSLNSESKLVNAQGLRVQGYGVDDGFNVVTTQLRDIEIPLGKLNVAQETTVVDIEGALNTGEDAVIATQATILESGLILDGVGNPITQANAATTLLTDLTIGGASPFADGETLSFTPRKGAADYDAQAFDIEATTTLADFMQFLDDSLGLNSGVGVPADPSGAAGVSIANDGFIQVISNLGLSQAVQITGSSLDTTQAGQNGTVTIDLGFDEIQAGDGESAVVTFPVFDSLGQQAVVKMHAVLENKSPSATTFRYFLESTDDSDSDIFLQTGVFTLGADGEISGDPDANFTINRTESAANDITIDIDFSNISGLAALGANSTLNLLSQNGAPPGTLSSFNINGGGTISGIFSNGVIRSLGQIVLARFSNPLGLVEKGGTTYLEGIASGPAQIVAPGDQGSGNIRAGSVELSNTDVGRNLVELIVASTNYRGNARVISSTQQLVDELLVLGR